MLWGGRQKRPPLNKKHMLMHHWMANKHMSQIEKQTAPSLSMPNKMLELEQHMRMALDVDNKPST